ncbi:hypothetical protein Tco_0814733 [Tanacetum coccineum]
MNNKKHIMNLEYFKEMLQICPKIRNHKFEEPPFEQEILKFLVSLGHSGEIRKITDVNVNKLHQPWRSFAAVINKCLSGKSSYDSLRLSQAQIICCTDACNLAKELTNEDSKTLSLQRCTMLSLQEQGSRFKTLNSLASAAGDGVDILPKVPDDQVHEKTGTDEGASDKPEVLDVPEHHSNSEEESWTFSDDDDNDEDDDANKDSDTHDDDDDDDATESDDDGDNITHQSYYQTTDESEKQKDDDRVKDGEEDKDETCTNVILEARGDVDMTDAVSLQRTKMPWTIKDKDKEPSVESIRGTKCTEIRQGADRSTKRTNSLGEQGQHVLRNGSPDLNLPT